MTFRSHTYWTALHRISGASLAHDQCQLGLTHQVLANVRLGRHL